jgi:hypothetical protein
MQTYKTIQIARSAAADGAVQIVEIEHATEGRCYIVAKCSIEYLRKALAAKPMAEVVEVIAGHGLLSDAEIKAISERANAERNYDRLNNEGGDGYNPYR